LSKPRSSDLKSKFSKLVRDVVSSSKFFYFSIVFFALECIWIAFSALYPQAFDENFHFGLIQVYSHYWLPFLSKQPPGTSQYSALTRDPSYLYHYLMSFPYRFISLFTHSIDTKIIIIRLIDAALFTLGLFVFRKLFRKMGLSKGLINITIFLFVLIPIVPQLAAQVNYDDMLFLLVGWILLETTKVIDDIKLKKLSFKSLMLLLGSCILTSIVKYAFLPIFFAITLYLAIYSYKRYGSDFREVYRELKKSYRSLSRVTRYALIAFVLIAIGLFAQRDGYNLLKYHSFAPDCSQVLSVDACKAYSPWYVDYQRHQLVEGHKAFITYGPLGYIFQWFYWMWYRLFFAVNGPASNFYSYPPLPLPSFGAIILAVAGFVAVVRWWKRLIKSRYVAFLLTACGIYLLSLFVKSYATYHYTAVLENMNGRYLLPILLPLGGIVGLAFSYSLKNRPVKKALATVLIALLFIEGGGIITFIIRSDDTWYWPNSVVKRINYDAQKLTRHTVVKIKLNNSD